MGHKIRSSLIRKVYDGDDWEEPNVEFITPNDVSNSRYWSLPWSQLQGHVMLLDWETVQNELGINVCLWHEEL